MRAPVKHARDVRTAAVRYACASSATAAVATSFHGAARTCAATEDARVGVADARAEALADAWDVQVRRAEILVLFATNARLAPSRHCRSSHPARAPVRGWIRTCVKLRRKPGRVAGSHVPLFT